MTAEQEGSAEDPDRRRLALTELAFAPGADPRVAAEAAAALREYDAEQRRQREPASPSPASAGDPTPAAPDAPEEADPARPKRRVWLVAGVALAAAIALAATIQGVTDANQESVETKPSPSDPSPTSPLPSVLSRALDRAEVPTDALPVAIRGEVDLGSSRVIYDEDPSLSATADRWRLWVGYGVDSAQVCFVATYDNVGDAVSCVPKQRALVDRVVMVSTLPGRRFEMLANGGAIAVQVD